MSTSIITILDISFYDFYDFYFIFMSHLFIIIIMGASENGHLDCVRTLLEYQADINAKTNVRNQMMMMTLIIVLTMMMMMRRIEMIVDNDDRRSMYW